MFKALQNRRNKGLCLLGIYGFGTLGYLVPTTQIQAAIQQPPSLQLTQESTKLFDLPVTYNSQVKFWVRHFQSSGKQWFRKWLERSSRYLPTIQRILSDEGLPLDLGYLAMIESGFSNHAVSTAQAVGPWQFIRATGHRYGLKIAWWIDERKDLEKSSRAAARYIKDLYKIFQSWHLVAASYNMGESGVQRIIRKYNSHNYWVLVQKGAFSQETQNYVPKLMAAMLIAKAPGLYGFRNLKGYPPLQYDSFYLPGGTSLQLLADHLGVTREYLSDLNPELTKGIIPSNVKGHRIRIPKRSIPEVSDFIRKRLEGRAETKLSSNDPNAV